MNNVSLRRIKELNRLANELAKVMKTDSFRSGSSLRTRGWVVSVPLRRWNAGKTIASGEPSSSSGRDFRLEPKRCRGDSVAVADGRCH